jgi:hypothetical protein
MTIISKSALAAELNISRARVAQYEKRGLPIRSDGKIDREKAIEWIASNIVPDSASTTKGGARAAQIMEGNAAQPNPIDQVAALVLRLIALKIGSIVSVAAHEAGASVEIAKQAGELAFARYVDAASQLLVETGLSQTADLAVPVDLVERVDWTKLSKVKR